jgi:hypothetical protein
MQIVDGQTDEATLATNGYEAVQLLRSGEIGILAARFGYALAFDREIEIAIREDLAKCLGKLESPGLAPSIEFGREVKFFQPNDAGLFALVVCVVPTINGKDVLVELIVTSNGPDKYVTLEDISPIEL